MAKNPAAVTFKLRLASVKVVQFSQFDVSEDFDKNAYPLVEYQSDFNFKPLEKEQRILCSLTVTIRVIETGESFAQLTTEFDFEVSPLEKLLTKGTDRAEINTQLLYTIGSIAISTVRGILIERLRGSIIHKEVYPLINLVELFQQVNDQTSSASTKQ